MRRGPTIDNSRVRTSKRHRSDYCGRRRRQCPQIQRGAYTGFDWVIKASVGLLRSTASTVPQIQGGWFLLQLSTVTSASRIDDAGSGTYVTVTMNDVHEGRRLMGLPRHRPRARIGGRGCGRRVSQGLTTSIRLCVAAMTRRADDVGEGQSADVDDEGDSDDGCSIYYNGNTKEHACVPDSETAFRRRSTTTGGLITTSSTARRR